MAANPSIQLGTDGNWAIKEDNLLAYKKDGTRFFNKEFDFTRGSFATFVDKDGLVKISGLQETNLVQNGDFATSLSGWSNSNNHWQWTSQGAYFPLISTHNPLTQVLTNPVGVKLKITFTLNIVQGTVNFYYKNTSNSSVEAQYTQSGTYTLITQPVKQNTDINFSRYGGINTEFYLNNVSAFEIQLDVPRIDFTDDATGHLLLEPQSTNLITYSEDFSQWAKQSGGTGLLPIITLNDTISPDGTQNADKVIFNKGTGTTTSDLSILQASFTSQSNTASIYIKADSSQRIVIRNSSNWVGYDIGTEWTRIEKTDTGGSIQIGLRDGYGIANVPNTATVYLWGAQVEALSYATSYIPTFGSAATRNSEVCNDSGSAQDFNSEEGVLYAEIAALADDETHRYISISDGTNNNRIIIRYVAGSSNLLGMFAKIGNVTQVSRSITTDITVSKKIAVKYKLNDYALWVDGVEVQTDTSASVPPAGTFNRLNFSTGSGADSFLYGKTKNLKVFKRAMSDGELYLLTVPQYQSYQEMATALNYTL